MAVQRGFRDRQPGGQRRRGDLFPARMLKHAGQGLEDLDAPLAGARALARGPFGGLDGGGGHERRRLRLAFDGLRHDPVLRIRRRS
ncbi:hypothetical protein D3C72_1933670 [compost metagenome]